jgi:SAM-dependent methyltransferase
MLGGMGERPVHLERREYVPRARQEEWIVPLLRREIGDVLCRFAAKGKPRVALDAGCGGQPLRKDIESLGWRYVSLDVVAAPGVTPDFLGALDEAIPTGCVERGPYGLIVCTEVLEHVADWPRAWANLAEMLSADGVLVITCPFVYPLHEEPHDYWRPTTHAVRTWAERSGLEIVELKQLGNGWDVLGTIVGATKPERARGGVLAGAMARLVNWLRRLICAACASDAVRARVGLNGSGAGPLYLCNLAVLRKRARS